MNKPARQKPTQPATSKASITIHGKDVEIRAFLSNADAVVEGHASKAFVGCTLGHNRVIKGRVLARASHLSNVERDLAELKKVVAALAVRSVAQEEKAVNFDVEGMTVLDTDTAYRLLDNPPEPTEALRNLLTLR